MNFEDLYEYKERRGERICREKCDVGTKAPPRVTMS